MLDYGLNEQQKMVKDLARQIAEEKIKPFSKQWDEEEQFPESAISALAKADMNALCIPEKFGGMGGGIFDLCLAVEEVARVDGGVATSYAATFLGMFPILLNGTEEQKQKYLPQVASGKSLCAFALTEPEAGSDADRKSVV